MIIFKKAGQLNQYLNQQKKEGRPIGFVPTMGALHNGHLSLIVESKSKNDLTVCSIFINPTQFNNQEDFNKYPVTIENDIEKLEYIKCNVLFLPSVEEIYPLQFEKKHYELGYIENILEGKYRPGHFQGVCQVIDQFLKIVEPSNLYLGKKDYQQCMVVKKLVHLLGKEHEVKLNFSETVREADGLAMSSRNLRLSVDDREKSTTISKVLKTIKENYRQTEINDLLKDATNELIKNGFSVDYIEVRNAEDLREIENKDDKAIVLVAATINNIRLIDNLILN